MTDYATRDLENPYAGCSLPQLERALLFIDKNIVASRNILDAAVDQGAVGVQKLSIPFLDYLEECRIKVVEQMQSTQHYPLQEMLLAAFDDIPGAPEFEVRLEGNNTWMPVSERDRVRRRR